MALNYYLNGTLLRSIGVYISKSNGWRGLPKPKQANTESWNDLSGEFVYGNTHQLYEPRDITLDCVIIGTENPTKTARENVGRLISLLTQTTTTLHRLEIERTGVGRLTFNVYRTESITVDNSKEQAYTCTLKLREPQPQVSTITL